MKYRQIDNHKDYMVIRDKKLSEVTALTRRYIYDGWLPSGPIVPDKKHYLQAMIKIDSTN